MSNPNNICVHRGCISSTPHILKSKEGNPFAVEFYLSVKRNYRNQGVYLSDNIPMRLEGEAIMTFALTLKKGDKLNTLSSFMTKMVGEKMKSYFLIADIQLETEKENSTYTENRDAYVELPI